MITYTLLICSWALGVYYPDTGNIQICSSASKELKKEILIHELGHKFWFETMTEEERQEWTDLRNSYLLNYLFWHTEPSAIEDFASSIQEMYYKKECTYKDICKLNRKIIKLHSKK